MSILNLLHAIIVAKKAESLSPQQIYDLQQKRFKKLLRHVLQNSRFLLDAAATVPAPSRMTSMKLIIGA